MADRPAKQQARRMGGHCRLGHLLGHVRCIRVGVAVAKGQGPAPHAFRARVVTVERSFRLRKDGLAESGFMLHAHARISDPKPPRNQNHKRDSGKAWSGVFSNGDPLQGAGGNGAGTMRSHGHASRSRTVAGGAAFSVMSNLASSRQTPQLHVEGTTFALYVQDPRLRAKTLTPLP